jgi:hypothetical protein
LTITKYSIGQKYVFSPTGTMEYSKIYVDTVIKSKLKINGKTVFNYLDSTYSDTLNIRQYFSKKYDILLQDTIEYFFVANLTNKEINFKKLNKQLVAEELGRYENFGFKPLSFFIYPKCGTGINYDDLILKPSEILIIKSLTKRKSSKLQGQPNCFMKLLTGTNGILVSTRYAKPIGNKNFYINSEFQRQFYLIKKQLAFRDK